MGLKVWVTRSEPGASELAAALERDGHAAFKAPVLEVRALPFERPRGAFDWALFLSAHSARIAGPGLRGQIAWACAMGRRTQEALAEAGIEAQAPELESSEGLLDRLPSPAGKRVLVVAGRGGRNLLAPALERRGADVVRLEVYARHPLTPAVDASSIGIIAVSSGEGFGQTARLWLAAGGAPDVPVLAPSARVAALGAKLGLPMTHDCGGADARAVSHALARLKMSGGASHAID